VSRKNKLYFDFVIEELKLIIEIDGEQHFRQISNWCHPEITFERDNYKMNKALKNGYTIIRILQEDIWFDRNDWRENIKKYLKLYSEPSKIFIGCKDKYKNYIEY
jgi:very-short-patch-repair endonuclease